MIMVDKRIQMCKIKKYSAISGVNGGVNPVWHFIMLYPECRAHLIAEKLNMPWRTVQHNLNDLKKEGKVEFRGAPENGGCFVK